jgi:hypothetical protein
MLVHSVVWSGFWGGLLAQQSECRIRNAGFDDLINFDGRTDNTPHFCDLYRKRVNYFSVSRAEPKKFRRAGGQYWFAEALQEAEQPGCSVKLGPTAIYIGNACPMCISYI